MADITLEDVKSTLREHILAEFLPGESPGSLRDDTPLRTSGVLDSLATIKLVDFIEKTYGIEFDPHEIGIENFDSVVDIAALVVRKSAAS